MSLSSYFSLHHLGLIQTLNFTCAEPNTGRPKLCIELRSSTVDSGGRTLHVPNLIRGEKKYHPYCLKTGKFTGKSVKVTKPG